MNKMKLLNIAKYIEAELEKFDMLKWTPDDGEECGTIGCVGGWACFLYDRPAWQYHIAWKKWLNTPGDQPFPSNLRVYGQSPSIEEAAREALDLTPFEATELFMGGEVGMEFIQKNKEHVPELLRTMVLIGKISWASACDKYGLAYPHCVPDAPSDVWIEQQEQRPDVLA